MVQVVPVSNSTTLIDLENIDVDTMQSFLFPMKLHQKPFHKQIPTIINNIKTFTVQGMENNVEIPMPSTDDLLKKIPWIIQKRSSAKKIEMCGKTNDSHSMKTGVNPAKKVEIKDYYPNSHGFISFLRKNYLCSHYTPTPILNPRRKGIGLYSCDNIDEIIFRKGQYKTAKINIGKKFQAFIPQKLFSNYSKEVNLNCLWNPFLSPEDHLIEFLSIVKVTHFIKEDVVLEMLLNERFDFQKCLKNLISRDRDSFHNTCKWSEPEIKLFLQSLNKVGKRFDIIANNILSKSTKQCIEFYYLIKNLKSFLYKSE